MTEKHLIEDAPNYHTSWATFLSELAYDAVGVGNKNEKEKCSCPLLQLETVEECQPCPPGIKHRKRNDELQ